MHAMGFRSFATGEAVSARFIHLHIFAVEGITVSSAEVASTTIKGHACRVAIANTANAACQALLSDDFVTDEAEWQKERRCSGPYVLAVLGPTDEYTAAAGHIKEEADGSITTYDCFPAAKILLRGISNEALPELLTSLTCHFYTPGQHLRMRPVDSAISGETADGRTVHDLRLTMSAHAFALVAMDSATVKRRLGSAVALATSLNVKVARFFKLALFEDDELKRFLYFFLALEVQTHAAFRAVDHPARIGSFVPSTSWAGQSAKALFERHTENMKNLRDRFVWCALCAWTSIADSDVAEFKRLKDIRDAIAHGSIDAPPSEAVRAIEALVIKVMLQ